MPYTTPRGCPRRRPSAHADPCLQLARAMSPAWCPPCALGAPNVPAARPAAGSSYARRHAPSGARHTRPARVRASRRPVRLSSQAQGPSGYPLTALHCESAGAAPPSPAAGPRRSEQIDPLAIGPRTALTRRGSIQQKRESPHAGEVPGGLPAGALRTSRPSASVMGRSQWPVCRGVDCGRGITG